jgi:hypothetical protein
VFFSYNTPIARILKGANGRNVTLLTSESYGVTTDGKHKGHVRRAVAYVTHVVPDLFPDGTNGPAGFLDRGRSRFPSHLDVDHSGNIAHLLKEYSRELDSLMRVPCESRRVSDVSHAMDIGYRTDTPTRAHKSLYDCAARFESYSQAFALELALPNWGADAARVIERRDRLRSDPKAAAKREARAAQRQAAEQRQAEARAARDAQARTDAAEAIAQWRNGLDVRLPYAAMRDADGGAMLRVRGDMVQTSLGAEAPVSDVLRVLTVIYANIARGEAWTRDMRYGDDRQESYSKLGSFRLDSIDAQGNVRAGCHFITVAEIARLNTLIA